MESLHDIISKAEENYTSGKVSLGKYFQWSMHETIETIDAYLNSKHISGPTDSQGREKPFFNICAAVANVYYRATDIDRKNIRILPDNDATVAQAFIATILLRQWMNENRFGMFLNEWGRTLSKYGSAVVKFVEKDGLTATVVPWSRLIVDPIDFTALPVIEKFYKTPAQLRKMKEYDQEMVEALLLTAQSRENLDGQTKDNQNQFIELYEVHGELDKALLTGAMEETGQYVQQMHVVCSLIGKNGKRSDYTLYKGREKRNPYMLTHLIPEEGRTLSIGPIELLFEAQWMVNHSVKNQKDTLDLASRMIFQTSDKNYAGRNVLSSIETGDIFIHSVNEPLTRVANDKPDITALMNYGSMWQSLAKELTSTPESLRGDTLPSGTPYSLGAYLGGQASSLFSLMTENKGLYLEDMLRTFVIPYLKTKMDTKDEIVAVLEDNDIAEVDAMYVPRRAIQNYNQRQIQAVLQDAIPSPFQRDAEEQGVKESLAPLGNKRIFKPDELGEKTWKEALKDLEMRLRIEVTDENSDKAAVLQTLQTVFQTVASNPMILQDQNAKMVFNAILKETAVLSPIQLSAASGRPMAPQPQGELPDISKPNGANTLPNPTQAVG